MKNIVKEQQRILKGTMKGQRKMFRQLAKEQKRVYQRLAGYSSREPIPAKKKNEVKERVRRKYGRIVCEQNGKKPRDVTLEFHHKNMKNSDNSLDNLLLLCPNHHRAKHKKAFRRIYRDRLGRRRFTRLVKKTTKKKRHRRKSLFDIGI